MVAVFGAAGCHTSWTKTNLDDQTDTLGIGERKPSGRDFQAGCGVRFWAKRVELREAETLETCCRSANALWNQQIADFAGHAGVIQREIAPVLNPSISKPSRFNQ